MTLSIVRPSVWLSIYLFSCRLYVSILSINCFECYTEHLQYGYIIKMLEFLVENIFVVFAGKVFQQIFGIPMGINCAPLLADIFLYSYEEECIQNLLSIGRNQ